MVFCFSFCVHKFNFEIAAHNNQTEDTLKCGEKTNIKIKDKSAFEIAKRSLCVLFN